MCIHLSKLCDGVPDCTDGRDEGPHCRGNMSAEHSLIMNRRLNLLTYFSSSLFLFLCEVEVGNGIDGFSTSQFLLNQC